MDWKFEYLDDKDDEKVFCIITDDGKQQGQGISTRYHYYSQKPDKSIKALNHIQIPLFAEKPNKEEAIELMNEVTRFFNGWIPYQMKVLNK